MRAIDPRRAHSVRDGDFIKLKNLSSNGRIKTPLYRLIELRLTFGYRPAGWVFTVLPSTAHGYLDTYLVNTHFLGFSLDII